MPCQLVNTAVRSVLPFDPDASDLPVAWGLGFGFHMNPSYSRFHPFRCQGEAGDAEILRQLSRPVFCVAGVQGCRSWEADAEVYKCSVFNQTH